MCLYLKQIGLTTTTPRQLDKRELKNWQEILYELTIRILTKTTTIIIISFARKHLCVPGNMLMLIFCTDSFNPPNDPQDKIGHIFMLKIMRIGVFYTACLGHSASKWWSWDPNPALPKWANLTWVWLRTMTLKPNIYWAFTLFKKPIRSCEGRWANSGFMDSWAGEARQTASSL